MPRLTLEDLPEKYRAQVLRQIEVVPHAAPEIHNNVRPSAPEPQSGVCDGTLATESTEKQSLKRWSESEIVALTRFYIETPPLKFSIESIAQQLNRTPASVALKASKLGITDQFRPKSEDHIKIISDGAKARYAANPEGHPKPDWTKHPHPRGMLGKKQKPGHIDKLAALHTGIKQTPEHVEKRMASRLLNHGTLAPTHGRIGSTWKQGWREIDGVRIFFRSRWEFNYALYLNLLKKSGEISNWEHEPETFWFENIKRGCRSYLPDFRVTDSNGQICFHEVKGWMDPRSKTKIKRMAKYHPNVKLRVIDKLWFRQNAKNMASIIPQWEK